MLTKHLGKNDKGPASIDGGLRKIVDYLKGQGWSNKEFVFTNPSGFNRTNRMRPDRLGNLLYESRHTFQLAPEFLSSLPVSGIDGTLKDRMRYAMRGKVRAKTGYLSGVVGLAGYMMAPKGPPLTFVLMYNGPYKHDWEVRALFDRILLKISESIN
jgi:D-alanyl-D-alanine carboxypeptidase (penicillin-binding protein 4)